MQSTAAVAAVAATALSGHVSPRLTLPSLTPLPLAPMAPGQANGLQQPALPQLQAETEAADRPLARTPRPHQHPQRPWDSNAEATVIARLSLALDSAAASSLSFSLSMPSTSLSTSMPTSASTSHCASATAPFVPLPASSPAESPRAAATHRLVHPTPMVPHQRPLSIVNTLPAPTLPTLGPPRVAPPGLSTPGNTLPALPAHEPLSPLGLFGRHGQTNEQAGATSDTDTLSRLERRAARDPAPPYFDPTAHFYPELDALGNVRVTIPILPDLDTRQAVVKMIQMHYVPPLPSSSSSEGTPHDAVVPPGAMQQGAGDWVLFGHASARSLCYVYRQGIHVVTIALVANAHDTTAPATARPSNTANISSSNSNQLIIPLSPRSPPHHSRLLGHSLSRRNSSAGHNIQVYHAIDKRILPLSAAELAAAAEVLTFVQRRAHFRSTPKRCPSSASVASTRSSIHVPLHAPPKYYDLSLHRTATGSPPPFESLGMRPNSVRRLSISRRDAAAGSPSALMRRTLSRRGSGRIAAVLVDAAGPPCDEVTQPERPSLEAAPVALVQPSGKRKLGSGFMKRWSRVVGGGNHGSSSKNHACASPPSQASLHGAPSSAAIIPSPIASHSALIPSSRRSSSSSVASWQSHASPALAAAPVLAPVDEVTCTSPFPVPSVLATGSSLHSQAQATVSLPPPPVPPKDHRLQQLSPSTTTGSNNGGGHKLTLSPSMLFKKVKAALPTGSSSSSSKAD